MIIDNSGHQVQWYYNYNTIAPDGHCCLSLGSIECRKGHAIIRGNRCPSKVINDYKGQNLTTVYF